MKILNYKNWTPEQKRDYIERWQYSTGPELRSHYNVSQRTITGINKFLGLNMNTGTDAEGNPIKKSYRTRKDAYPKGTIVYHRNHQKGKTLAYVITPEGRIRLHIHNWKQAGREIPEGFVLGFKDLNPENCELENLVLKTRAEVARANNRKAYPQRPAAEKKERPVKQPNPVKAEIRRIAALKREERIKAGEDRRKAKEVKENRLRIEREWQMNARKNRTVKRMETKTVDLSSKIPVRIDPKTIVYVNPGTDIESIRKRYLKAG